MKSNSGLQVPQIVVTQEVKLRIPTIKISIEGECNNEETDNEEEPETTRRYSYLKPNNLRCL